MGVAAVEVVVVVGVRHNLDVASADDSSYLDEVDEFAVALVA